MLPRNFWWRIRKVLLTLLILGTAGGVLYLLLNITPSPSTPLPEASGPSIRLQVNSGRVVVIPLEKYLVGVLAAEMPVSFQEEALKAQAVAARTFALKRLGKNSPDSHHPEADLCADSQYCQGWLSEEEMLAKWGRASYFVNRSKLEKAVVGTRSLVLTYDGRFAEPAYHANSGGRTENSRDVWQEALPYLQSVPSPWDKGNPGYLTRLSYTYQELDSLLGSDLSAKTALAARQRDSGQALKALSYTGTGRLKAVQVGNKNLPGTELRRLLRLPSTNLSWQVKPDGEIIFTALGKGHGVGMSQYGTNSLAGDGKNFRQILAYYYPGTELGAYR